MCVWKRGRERAKERQREEERGVQEEREGETEINLSQGIGLHNYKRRPCKSESAGQDIRKGNPVRLEPSRHRVQRWQSLSLSPGKAYVPL